MDEAKIKEVFSDEAFVKELMELETPAEVQSKLKAKGIDMTESEIIALKDEIIKAAEKADNGEELSLDALDEAAGGVGVAITTGAVIAIAAVSTVIAGGTVVSTGLGIGLGALMGSRRW